MTEETKSSSFPAWTKTAEATAAHFKVDPEKGLSDAKVEESRKKYGWNELDKEDGKPLWKLVLEQFDDALVKVCVDPSFASVREKVDVDSARERGGHGRGRKLAPRLLSPTSFFFHQ